jgi:branched-chain amino acid transport system ATP-binding protein
MLSVEGVVAGYGNARVLHGVDLSVGPSVTCVIGPNGAGKTTLARTISGTVRCRAGRVTFDGTNITNARPERIVAMGLVQVFEGRELFPDLSVRENLDLGSFARFRRMGREGRAAALELVHELFPRLADRAKQRAGTLSGGEQQMLAIGRALMSRPSLLLLDEPSLGLAPIVIQGIYAALERLAADGVVIVLVEEDPQRALTLASSGVVLVSGQSVAAGTADELRDEIELAYLGRRTTPDPLNATLSRPT